MTKNIYRIKARRRATPIAGIQTNTGDILAVDDAGRDFYAKSDYCCKTLSKQNSAWLRNELIYYSIALRSNLSMPFSAILEIEGNLYWGSQIISGRRGLPKVEGESQKLFQTAFAQSKEQSFGLARALLLDIALLNSDREPWNILIDSKNELYYYDHDKSLLGDAREKSESPFGDLGRIEDAAVSVQKIRDYLHPSVAYTPGLSCLSDQEIREIYDNLRLNCDSLQAAMANCPSEWVSETLFARLQHFLLAWWGFLREQIFSDNGQSHRTNILLRWKKP